MGVLVDVVLKSAVESGFVVEGRVLSIMSGRTLICCLLVLSVGFALACNSNSSRSASSVPSSAQQDKPGTPQADDGKGPNGNDDAISYAKNPERFVKEKTFIPPFNVTNPKSATDFFDVGVHEDNLHNYDKAIAAYEQALALKPDWALVCVREAKDYKRMGQRNKAISQLQRATRIDPHYWDAYSELALTYKEAGDTNHAIDAAAKLLSFPPMQLPVHNQLGYWYEEVGNREKARQQFEMYRDLAAQTKSEQQTDRYEAALHELQKLSK